MFHIVRYVHANGYGNLLYRMAWEGRSFHHTDRTRSRPKGYKTQAGAERALKLLAELGYRDASVERCA